MAWIDFCTWNDADVAVRSVDVTVRVVSDQGGQHFVYPARQVEQVLKEVVAQALTKGTRPQLGGVGAGAGGFKTGLMNKAAPKPAAAPAAATTSATLLKTLDSFGCEYQYSLETGQFIKRVRVGGHP